MRAWTLWWRLDLDAALADAEAAEACAQDQDAANPLLLAVCVLAMIHHQRGDLAAADRAAEACARVARTLEPSGTTRLAACILASRHADQDPERCLLEMLALARAAVAAGRLEDAERWAHSRLARAEVLLARGDAAGAARLAAEAATDAGPLGAVEARLLAGRALDASGETQRAKAELQYVAAQAARARALPLRDAAARELRHLGTRVAAPGRRAAPGELSGRESEIARLVAEGRANKQVAAALHLSEKTVENALTRIYAKVGVHSRTQLALELKR